MQVGGAAGGHASEMIKLGRLAGASSTGSRVDSSQLRAAAVPTKLNLYWNPTCLGHYSP